MLSFFRRYKGSPSSEDLPPPSTESVPSRNHCSPFRWVTGKQLKYAFAIIISVVILRQFLPWATPYVERIQLVLSPGPPLPPLYSKFHEEELRLPQHNPDLSFPEGREGKYIWVANGPWGVGWGNVMQELILDAYLAHLSGRSFVFNNYTWSVDAPYADYKGKLIPSSIPLRALVNGPLAGDPFPDGGPRSVGREYFAEICPTRTVISTTEVVEDPFRNVPGDDLVNMWLEKLNSTQDRCVEIDGYSPPLFGLWILGSPRLLGLWPSLSTSPLITHFRWSPLIHDAFNTNYRLFASPLIKVETTDDPDIYKPIPGLLALHIRRGDYEEHCANLAAWRAGWNGFNSFPQFPDKFEVPPDSADKETDGSKEYYLSHCLPTIEEIVAKVQAVRETDAGKGLKNVYIMTNGKRPWVTELKAALRKSGNWDSIASSRDMKLTWEQRFVAQAVDMLIGQRAQVLIGNGFSSLTSNIVMLRMARTDLPPESNRFW